MSLYCEKMHKSSTKWSLCLKFVTGKWHELIRQCIYGWNCAVHTQWTFEYKGAVSGILLYVARTIITHGNPMNRCITSTAFTVYRDHDGYNRLGTPPWTWIPLFMVKYYTISLMLVTWSCPVWEEEGKNTWSSLIASYIVDHPTTCITLLLLCINCGSFCALILDRESRGGFL